jgi:potassium-transporting ATPase ATP-binding subunit
MRMKIINKNYLERFRKNINKHKNKSGISSFNNNKKLATRAKTLNTRILSDSLTKLDPRYLAKNNPVMFAVEVGLL